MLAVFLPSAQTFINIASQSSENPTSNLQRNTVQAGQIKKAQIFSVPEARTKFKISKFVNEKKIIFGENSAINITVHTWRGF